MNLQKSNNFIALILQNNFRFMANRFSYEGGFVMKISRFAVGIVALCAFSSVNLWAWGSKKIRNDITVISREAGSGTRGAFIELFGVEVKNAQGKKVDMTTENADITNSTEVVITSVSGNPSSIGYISLGSLNDSVKAVEINGAKASVENIKNGTYKVSRPFNIVTKENISSAAEEFMKFILSSDGQAIVEKNGYISAVKNSSYSVGVTSGKVSVAGSSSVFPVMEKLAEAFKAKNPGIVVEVSQSDSTTGVNSAIQGVCDIGMASRDLKSSEKGVVASKIAIDGIAVVVNKKNPVSSLSSEQVRKIFVGEITKWSEVR